MPRKPRKPRVMKQSISPALRSYFEFGGYDNNDEGAVDVFLMESSPEFKPAWEGCREEIMADWIRKNPCSRPWAWWVFDLELTEPRRRIGGIGDTLSDQTAPCRCSYRIPPDWVTERDIKFYNGRMGFKDIYGKPIPSEYKDGDFTKVAPDPNDPPTFESEAAYLQRHDLLSQEEKVYLKKHPELMEPVTVVFNDEDD